VLDAIYHLAYGYFNPLAVQNIKLTEGFGGVGEGGRVRANCLQFKKRTEKNY